MKRKLLLISLYALTLSASAQFTIQSSGNNYITCNPGGKSGISLITSGNNSGNLYGGHFSSSYASTAVGLRGYAASSSTCVGVTGHSVMGSKTIGVLGSTDQNYTSSGVGVYGTVHGDMGSALMSNEVYAGFFYGNVRITGNLNGTTIQGTLLGDAAGESSSSASGLSLRSSVASSLSGLSVTTYQKERPAPLENIELIEGLEGDSLQKGMEPEPDIMEEQYYGKTHYALDADRLEETFPDLVYVDKDGNKSINYVEMIPLLVQSINELNAKIEVLEGQASEDSARKARSTTDIQASSSSQNKLYQNTPNPFKEQTVIRFSLADDVQNAAICIFDMTGKTVKKFPVSSGMESVSVGGYELGEGMFLYSLVVNGQEIDTKRMIISK